GRRGGRDEAPPVPIEEEQLEPQENGGDRRGEDGRHPPGGAGYEEGLALDRRQAKGLAEQGSKRAAGDDGRSLGGVGTPGADRERRGQRLEDRDLGIHPAPPDENRLEGFRDTVAADLLGAVARHQTDDH